MILLLALIALTSVGVFFIIRNGGGGEGWAVILPVSAALVGGVALLSMAIAIPVCHATQRTSILQFRAFRESLSKARENPKLSDMEKATLLSGIITWNQWLATEKYWLHTQWFIFSLSEIDELSLLE